MHALIASLYAHIGKYPEDEKSSENTITWIEKHWDFAFVKENLEGHITGSIFIINPDKTKILLIFHKKLQKWLQFWGHADGEKNIQNVAIREFQEESGILIAPKILWDILHVDVHDVPEYKWKPEHRHFDIRYLWIIDDTIPLFRQEEEVDDIRWFAIDEVENYNNESSMMNCILRIKNIS